MTRKTSKRNSVTKNTSTLQLQQKLEQELPTTTMPVLMNKYNEMLENFNIIRDILNKPTIDLNELRQLLTRVSQDENIYFITQDIMTKIIYYIIEMAHDELQYEKYEYLEQTLERVTDIIRSDSHNKKDELKRLRTKCQTDNESPYFDSLMHITTTVVTEAIKLLYYTTRAELHPHGISSDEENAGGEDELDSEEDNELNNF